MNEKLNLKPFLVLILVLLSIFVNAQNKAEEYYQKGKAKLQSNDTTSALANFKLALEADSAHINAIMDIGRINGVKDKELAKPYFMKVVSLFKQSGLDIRSEPFYLKVYSPAFFELGLIYEKTKPDSAFENFLIAAMFNQENMYYKFKFAELSMYEKKYESAAELFEKIIFFELKIHRYRRELELVADKNSIDKSASYVVLKPELLPILYEKTALCYKKIGNTEKENENTEKAKLFDNLFNPNNKKNNYYETGIKLKKNAYLFYAITAFEKAISIKEKPETYYQIGLCYKTLHKSNKALENFDKALKISYKHPEILIERALIKIQNKEYDAATNDLKKSLKYKKDNYLAYANLGLAYSFKKDYKKALKNYNTALKLNSDDTITYFNRAITKSYLQNTAEAMKDYELFLEKKPNHRNALYNIALIYNHNYNNTEKALEYYLKIIEIDRHLYKNEFQYFYSQHEHTDFYANIYYKIALIKLKNKEQDLAFKYFMNAFEYDNDKAEYLRNIGDIYMAKEAYKDAVSFYDHTLSLEYTPETEKNRVICYDKLDENEKTTIDFEQTFNRVPKSKKNIAKIDLYDLGIKLTDKALYRNAVKAFNKAFESEADKAGENAYYSLGICYDSLEYIYLDNDAPIEGIELKTMAIENYTKAINIKPKLKKAILSRGICYGKIEKYEQSIADFSKLIEIDKQYPEAYMNRGIAYSMIKEYEKSISDFNIAIKLKPKLGKAYFNRGGTYVLLEKYNKAKADFSKANSFGYKAVPFFIIPKQRAETKTIAHYPLTINNKDIKGINPPVKIFNCPFKDGGIYSNGKYAGPPFEDLHPEGCLISIPETIEFDEYSFEMSLDFKVLEIEKYQGKTIFAFRLFTLFLQPDGMLTLYLGREQYHSKQLFANNTWQKSAISCKLNKWHSVTLTYSENAVKLYFDGRLLFEEEYYANYYSNEITNTDYSSGNTFKGYWKNFIIKNVKK